MIGIAIEIDLSMNYGKMADSYLVLNAVMNFLYSDEENVAFITAKFGLL